MIGDAELDEVLDIRLPTFANSNMVFDLRKGGGPLPFEFNPDRMVVEKSSARSSASPKVMVTKGRRDETADTSSNYASESSLSGLDAGLRQIRGSGRAMRSTSLEGRIVFGKVAESDDEDEDAGEMPFMWLSRNKPPLKSIPIILPPPQRIQHRRVGSLETVAQHLGASGNNPGPTRNRSFTQQIFPPVPTPSINSATFRSSSVSSTLLTPFGKNLNQTENAVCLASAFSGGSDTNTREVSEGRSVSDTSEGKQKERLLQERSEVVVTKSRRIVEHGEYWDDNQRTQVPDVIPTLRALKAEK